MNGMTVRCCVSLMFLLQIAIQLAAHILEKYYPSHIIARLSISEDEFWDNKVRF